MRNDLSVVPVSKGTSGRCRRHDLSPSFLANSFVRQKLLWPRKVIVSSNVVESDLTTARDFESRAVVGSDPTTLDERRPNLRPGSIP